MSHQNPQYFFITSQGFCGTRWLASAMNLHARIYCTHSLGPHNKIHEEYTDREILENSAASVRNQNEDPLDVLTRHVEDVGVAPDRDVIGNVHGYSLIRMYVNQQQRGGNIFDRRVRIANLVRHPVDWVASSAANWRHQAKFSIFARKGMIGSVNRSGTLSTPTDLYEFVDALSRAHGFDMLDWDVLAFVYACDLLSAVGKDHLLCGKYNIPVIRMEDITTGPTHLDSCIRYISGGRTSADADFLARVEGLKVRNRHRKVRRTTEETYLAWAPWQRALFGYCMAASKLLSYYRDPIYRYDLSFVKPL